MKIKHYMYYIHISNFIDNSAPVYLCNSHYFAVLLIHAFRGRLLSLLLRFG